MEVVIKYRRTDNSVQTLHRIPLVIDNQKGTVLCTAGQFGKYILRVEHTFADNGRVQQRDWQNIEPVLLSTTQLLRPKYEQQL
jgi:hypothetical protein